MARAVVQLDVQGRGVRGIGKGELERGSLLEIEVVTSRVVGVRNLAIDVQFVLAAVERSDIQRRRGGWIAGQRGAARIKLQVAGWCYACRRTFEQGGIKRVASTPN